MRPILIVISETDPVAVRVAERWGTPPATGDFVEGAAIRALAQGAYLLRRPGPHIHDERLDARLPSALRAATPTLVFPSIHRSEQNVASLTVHPIGNPGPTAEVGGEPRELVPADPRRMCATLRLLAEGAAKAGAPATLESTHHGPMLDLPAYFVEIGYGEASAPSDHAVAVLSSAIPSASPEPEDRVALALGGGHYAPHFTDLVLTRRWSVGHILSRHSLEVVERRTIEAAWRATPEAEGVLYARAADADRSTVAGIAPRLRDGDAPRRLSPTGSPGGGPTSGT